MGCAAARACHARTMDLELMSGSFQTVTEPRPDRQQRHLRVDAVILCARAISQSWGVRVPDDLHHKEVGT